MSRSTSRTTRRAAGSAAVPAGAFGALSVLCALAALCAALAPTAPASAHAAYASSSPTFAAVLDSAPEQIELRFTQQLFRREGANAIHLERADDGAEIALGEIAIDNIDRARMRAALLGPLAPGRYLVAWRNLSADDGDTDQGSYPFYVGRPPTADEEAADRALAAALLIAYPDDDLPAAADESEAELRAPAVVRREAEPAGGVAASSIVWLALGGAALLAIGAGGRRWSRAP